MSARAMTAEAAIAEMARSLVFMGEPKTSPRKKSYNAERLRALTAGSISDRHSTAAVFWALHLRAVVATEMNERAPHRVRAQSRILRDIAPRQRAAVHRCRDGLIGASRHRDQKEALRARIQTRRGKTCRAGIPAERFKKRR